METIVPSTVRQAWWLIVGGVFATIMGVLRGIGFFTYGGLMLLVLFVLFVSVGLASVAGAAIRIRRGDTAVEAGTRPNEEPPR
jgi:hypothetical protein